MRISVKELAEFVHRRGDIRYHYQSATFAQEGVARQKAWQEGRGGNYQRERRVAAVFGALEVSGRIDGWDADAGVVEEVKTTRADPHELHAHAGDVHTAQLRLYGALLVLEDDTLDELVLRLVYLHPAKPGETVVEETAARADLIGYFETTCAIFAAWIANVRARIEVRNRELRGLGFPYGEFRADQRRLAKHIYRGFRDQDDWLVEAPTGSGKTMASLFAALKAMGADELDRVVFLTARTTGQRAVEDALRDAVGDLDGVVAVTVTAKDRICFNPETSCDPASCEYARGYYERMPAARRDLLARRLIRREEIEDVAREHRVCPFQLSLDAVAWADVVVCDYNHVFDPIVRLARRESHLFTRAGLIVDEAHQLGERVREMLGSRLSRQVVKSALAEPGLSEPFMKRLRSVERALAALAREQADVEREVPKPGALLRAIERLTTLPEAGMDVGASPAASTAYLDLLGFGRAAEWAEEGAFHYLAHGTGRRLVIELACTVPGPHIRESIATFHGSARLSGTLTPTSVFQRIHGLNDSARTLVSAGCFPPENLGVFLVTDLSTYYRDRERTLSSIAALILRVCTQTTGNYLVAMPSFEYAEAVAAAVAGVESRCQARAMTLDEREDFIRWITERDAGRLGFVVMGGVFAESVDFDGGALDGVIVVGAGLPPRSLKRDLVARDSAAAGLVARAGSGADEIAYRQPAMTRVVQAAGRVVRSATDRGVAVLVDPRFANAAYRAFLPSRWRIRRVRAHRVAVEVGQFWFGDHPMMDRTGSRRGEHSGELGESGKWAE